MGSKQVADDTIKILGAVMLLLFVLPFLTTMVDCAGVATGLHEPEPDPYADFEADLERAIEQAEARQQQRWEARYGKTGNGRAPERVAGAFYADAEEEAAASSSSEGGSLLLMAGGLLVSVVGCVGAIAFLMLGGREEDESTGALDAGEEAGVAQAAAPEPQPPPPRQATTRSASREGAAPPSFDSGEETPAFDEYGRPADYEPVPLEGYWTHLALVAVVGGIAVVLIVFGPMNIALCLGLTFG